jgi:uncharacterized membrane protein
MYIVANMEMLVILVLVIIALSIERLGMDSGLNFELTYDSSFLPPLSLPPLHRNGRRIFVHQS